VLVYMYRRLTWWTNEENEETIEVYMIQTSKF